MFTLERQNEIMEILKKNKFISINELAKRFYISTASIRRDLEKLEQQGLVKRTYGGVMLVEGVHAEIPLVVREAEQKNAKLKIAQAAASLIRNQDTVFFDSSTTTRQICGFLGDKSNLTVITNGIRAISALAEYDNVAVYGISGKLRHHSLSMVGSQAESFVRDFWASKLFFSCTGLSMSHGAMDYSDAEAEVRKTMMNVCQKKILLVDHTKLERPAFYRICSFSDIDTVITDKKPNEKWEQLFMQNNIKLICVES